MVWQRAGTVAVQNGSSTVVGTSVDFAASCRNGDSFVGPDGASYEVANVASATVISILPAYKGATVSGASYAIMPVQGYDKTLSDAFNTLVNQFGAKLAALGTTGNYDILPVDKGGTGNAIGTAQRLVASALVGTATQSSGTPTGAVMQRGSNANGEFVRFADGTQICWATTTATVAVNLGPASGLYYGTTPWTYPAQFSAAPVPRCSASSGGVLTFEIPASTSTTSASVAIGAISAIASRSYTLAMFAIGRWY